MTKRMFWNVVIEIYEDGTTKAAVTRSRLAVKQPADGYVNQPKREVYSIWFESEVEAHGAVAEALGWNEAEEAAAA